MTTPMPDFRIFNPNPDEVIYQMSKADFRYTNTKSRSDDVGFGKVAVIPALFNFTIQTGKVPRPDECVAHVMTLVDSRYTSDLRAKKRAQKLTLDFYRDLHTLGLLGPHFAHVTYQKGHDIRLNVDFLAALKSYILELCGVDISSIAVQAKMFHPREWAKVENNVPGNYIELHEQRRLRQSSNKEIMEWDGPLYYISNQNRPYHKSVNSVWLFGSGHVHDLMEQIKADLSYHDPDSPQAPPIGIQTKFWE